MDKKFGTPAALVFLVLILAPLALAQSNGSNGTGGNGTAGLNGSGNGTGNGTVKPKLTGIDAEMQYFLKPGETSEYKEVTSGGSKYYLIKINGKESVVLDSGYNAVPDDALTPVVSAYLVNLDFPFKQGNMDAMKSAYATLKRSLDNCQEAYYNFTSGRMGCFLFGGKTLPCSTVYYLDFGTFYNISFSLGEARKNIEAGNVSMNNSMTGEGKLEDDIENAETLLQSNNVSLLGAKLQEIMVDVDEFNAAYAQFNAGFSKMLSSYEFRHDGGLERCSISADSASSIKANAAVYNQFPTVEQVTTAIRQETANRLAAASSAKNSAPLDERLQALKARYEKFKHAFSAVSDIQPTAVIGAYTSADNAVALLKNATNATQIAKLAADAKSKVTAFETALQGGEATVSEYATSKAAIANATSGLKQATQKYGTNDPRLADAKKNVDAMKAVFELKEADFKAGRPVTGKDFQAITANATNLSMSLFTMKGMENSLDPGLIAVIVLVILAVVGGVLYIRKMRAQQGYR